MRIPSQEKPWLKYYSNHEIHDVLPKDSIYDYLYNNNINHLNDIAMIYYSSKIDYKTLFDNIDKCSKSLQALDVKQGDIVTIALPSVPEAMYIVYAVNKIGAIANLIHPLASANEIKNYLNEVNSEVFFMFTGTYELFSNELSETNVKHAIVISPSNSLTSLYKLIYKLSNKEKQIPNNSMCIDYNEFISLGDNRSYQKANRDIYQTAIISHTGGTTGEPKGCMLSDYNINSIIWQIGMLPHKRQERMLVVLPPFINYSLANSMLEPLALGISIVLIPNYEPQKFDEYIKKYHPNHINSIPAYWEALLKNEKLNNIDLSCLKFITAGGDGLNSKMENDLNEFLSKRGVELKLAKGHGCTEMTSCTTFSYEKCNEVGSVGIPLVKNNCKIIDPETYEELTYNHEGELCFSGPSLMIGYYNKLEDTNELIKIHEDGERWIHTGDLARMTEDGVVYITGRIKRIIMTKGNDGIITKIFPDRIEKALIKHHAVKTCCAIGVRDKERINYPKAYVILNESYEKTDDTRKELIEYSKNELPNYMVPEDIEFIDDFPRTQRGKIDYRALENRSNNLS